MNLVGNICQQASQNILQMSVFHWIVSTVVEEKKKNGKVKGTIRISLLFSHFY